MSSEDNPDDGKRSPAILKALDTVHRSLLFKNLEFNNSEGNYLPFDGNPKRSDDNTSSTRRLDNLSDEVKSKFDKTKSQYKTHNNIIEFNSTDLENVQNSVCEKLNKNCAHGVCYCFNSDSDDFERKPREPPINLFNNGNNRNAGTLNLLDTINNLSDYLSSINCTTTDDDEYFTSHDYDCDSLKNIKFVNRKNSLRRKKENRQLNLEKVEETQLLDIESQIISTKKKDDDVQSTSTHRLSRDFDEVFRYNQSLPAAPISPQKLEPIVEPKYIAFRSRNNVNIELPHKSPTAAIPPKQESEDVRLINLFMNGGMKSNTTITENLDKPIPKPTKQTPPDDDVRLFDLFMESGGLKGSNGIKTNLSKEDLHNIGNQMIAESQETVIPNPKVKKTRSPANLPSVEHITIPAIPVQIGQQNGRRKKIKIRISAKSEKRNQHDISHTSNETSSQTVDSTENTQGSFTIESSTENTSYREYREPRIRREIVNDDDSPAIHIIQEISPDSFEVSSKVILNKKKIRDLQNKKKKVNKKSPKPTRKIITDNFCNEIIDNLNRSFDDALQNDDRRSSIIDLNSNELASGRLEANPKYSGRIIGELFARRLIKMEQKKQKSRTSLLGSSFENQMSDVVTSCSTESGSDNSKSRAPKKPPRTFVSSNSTVECDDEWLQTRLKNLLNEDVIPKSELGKKIGWSMPPEKNDNIKPSCPTYDELGCHVGWFPPDENKKRGTGWIFVDETGKQTEPPQSILNMLNYEPNQNVYTMLSTSNSKPSPQSKRIVAATIIPPKESIDTVDSVFRIGPGNSPKKKKFNDFENFVENTTLKSTPEKLESARFIELERCADTEYKEIQEFPEEEEEGKPPNSCKKCALKKSDKKRSRVNDALKRTKSFFNSRIPILKHKNNTSDPELYVTPIKRTNLTATNMDLSSNKKKFNLVKNLGLITPKKLFQSQQPSQFQCDSCHTSKTTSNNASPARNFDFNRVVVSPKAKSFRLSPKRLFSNNNKNESPNPPQQSKQQQQPQQSQSKLVDKNNIETYKSFADDNQSIMVQMGEFLSNVRGNLEQDNINNFNRNRTEIDNNMDDPIYAEIKMHKTSPVRDAKVTELRYTVNNDPTAVYTVVDKKPKTVQQATYDDCSIERKLSNEKYQKQHSYDTPERSLDDVSSYDASKFLRAALGSETLDSNYYDTIESRQQPRDKRTPDTQELTVSLENVSDLISYQSPNESMITPPLQSPSNTSRFNNSIEFYRGVKEKLRNSIKRSKRYLSIERRKIVRSPNKQDPFERNQFNIQSEGEKLYQTFRSKLNESNIEITDQYLLHLINQISYQKSIKMQLSNAVSICRTTKEFECSTELIEAERLLLVSNFKELAAKDELVRIDYQRNGKIKNPSFNLGTLSIDHIECPLKDGIVRDNISNYFYIAMCSYKDRVLCTTSVERKGDRIIFPQCNIYFKDLEPDYEIKLDFFALRLRKTIRSFSHESKFHLNKESKGFLTTCPSPPKLSPGKLFHPTTSLPKKLNFDAEFSRFKSQGFIELTSFTITSTNMDDDNHNLTKIIKKIGNSYQFCLGNRKEFKLSSIIYNSNLSGEVMLSLKTEILLKNEIVEGFLNVGECHNECDSILWNRRWCRLDGLYLYFWNYPNQLHDDLKFKIDLTRTIYDEINLVDRSLCARSRTFVIEVFGYRKNDTKKSYYLSADNQTDLTKWMYELNNKIKFIRDWKI